MSQQLPGSPPPLKHSGPGIASAIVSGCSFIFGIIATLLFSLHDHKFVLGPFCTCGLPTGFAGIILGIIGLVLPGRKKLFAYVGLILGLLILIINGVFIFLGWID